MTGIGIYVLCGVAGAVLGTLFFAGLWWTVRALPGSRHPALLMFGSYMGRMAVLLAGFYLLGAGDWRRLVAALAGFILVRILILPIVKSRATTARITIPVHEEPDGTDPR
jgi:F1F0 ATPase subunit 2